MLKRADMGCTDFFYGDGAVKGPALALSCWRDKAYMLVLAQYRVDHPVPAQG